MDGDGDLDAATGALSNGYNAVFVNDGNGEFVIEKYELFGSQAVRLADLDEDDDLDLMSVGGGGGVLGTRSTDSTAYAALTMATATAAGTTAVPTRATR